MEVWINIGFEAGGLAYQRGLPGCCLCGWWGLTWSIYLLHSATLTDLLIFDLSATGTDVIIHQMSKSRSQVCTESTRLVFKCEILSCSLLESIQTSQGICSESGLPPVKTLLLCSGKLHSLNSQPVYWFCYIHTQTQTYIRVYDLARQEMVKKLLPGVKWISSMTLHPTGDHVLIGSYDKRLCWLDLDLSSKPYKVLRWVYTIIHTNNSDTLELCMA